MANKFLKKQILSVVDNQLNQDDPKETKITFQRLIKNGYSKQEAKEMIAAVIAEEMFDILENQERFNEKRYTEKLKSLK